MNVDFLSYILIVKPDGFLCEVFHLRSLKEQRCCAQRNPSVRPRNESNSTPRDTSNHLNNLELVIRFTLILFQLIFISAIMPCSENVYNTNFELSVIRNNDIRVSQWKKTGEICLQLTGIYHITMFSLSMHQLKNVST